MITYENEMTRSIEDYRTTPDKRTKLAHYYMLKGDSLQKENIEEAFDSYIQSALEYKKISLDRKAYEVLGLMTDADVRDIVPAEYLESAQVASDLKFIFEEASVKKDGKYVLNEGKIAQKFGSDNVATISAFVKLANGEQLTANNLKGVPHPEDGGFSTASWGSCVANQIIDFTGIGLLTGAMTEMIEKKLWDKLAVEIIKIIEKNAINGGCRTCC
ncbi:hypothetical protein ABE142_22555 [Paenibacillus alvei]|uniref:hypothetical protein n=1 Tax=Paenibacillus alvei TaxID=44250 RepID=UPI003D280173